MTRIRNTNACGDVCSCEHVYGNHLTISRHSRDGPRGGRVTYWSHPCGWSDGKSKCPCKDFKIIAREMRPKELRAIREMKIASHSVAVVDGTHCFSFTKPS